LCGAPPDHVLALRSITPAVTDDAIRGLLDLSDRLLFTMGRDLHDHSVQHIAAVALVLGQAQSASRRGDAASTERLLAHAQEMLAETAQVINEISYRSGLVSGASGTLEGNLKARITMASHGAPLPPFSFDAPRYDELSEALAHRIFASVIEDICRRNPTKLRIQASGTSRTLTIRIADDANPPDTDHMPFSSPRDAAWSSARASALGGRITRTREHGRTITSIELPMGPAQ
jgi:hypothetical protein